MTGGMARRLGLVYVLLFTLCIFAISSDAGVTFERTYGGPYRDGAQCVQQTSDGGYILAGYTDPVDPDQRDMYIIKTDEEGDTVWTAVWGDAYFNSALSVQQTSDNGYIVGGRSVASTPAFLDALRFDPSGGLLWTRRYSGGDQEALCTAQETADGGYYISGQSPDFKSYLIKMNSIGDSVWARSYEGKGWWARCSSSKHTPDGGYILVGDTRVKPSKPADAYIVRTDSSGNALWQMYYGWDTSENALSVALTSDGGYVVAIGSDIFGPNWLDALIIKTDSAGNVQWETWYGGSSADVVWCVQQTADGGYIMGGETDSYGEGNMDVWLVKTDSLGYVSWMRTYGGPGEDRAFSVQETSDGGYIIVGETGSFGNVRDIYLIKTDKDGRVRTCEPIEPWEPRTQGYWRRQCKSNPREDLCAYVDSIRILTDLFDAFDCDSVCDLMNVDPPKNDMCRKARRQFMALLLNVASGKLATCNCLEDGREVGDVIAEIDSLLANDPDFHTCEHAKTLADDLNNGIGIVPCDTVWTQVPPRAVERPSICIAPNPFSRNTVIKYEVKAPGLVRLDIYDLTGRLVETLVNETQQSGIHQVSWNASSKPDGIYYYRLQAGGFTETRKLVHIK